jgi:uncharacterized sulfatase
MKKYERNTMLAFALIAGASVSAQQKAEPAKKYNVLFIASDDLNTDMHCYGDPRVKTPNIDRISRQGVRFDRAYNQFPLSGPSRASLMTGYRPDKTGVYDLRVNFRENLPSAVTIAQLFKENGYFSGRVGKIFHYGVPGQIGTDGMDDSQSWTQRFNPIGIDKTEEHKVTNYTPNRGLGSSLSFMATDGTDNEHTDAMTANVAIQMMRQHKDEPFFLAVGFFRPHCPYIAPRKYFDMYPPDGIQLPEERDDDWVNKPEAAKYTDPLHWGLSADQRKEVLRAYYASISFMDAQVGKLLDALDELGLKDNTIIVFWSDHGYHVGQHGQWMKQSLFEHVARTPLLISVPGVTNGTPSPRVVEFVDIYPTLAELCELSAPPDLDGKSLVPLLNNPAMEWNYPAFTQVLRNRNNRRIDGRSIRNERYRYTEWNKGVQGTELYDYETDPLEFVNLAGDKKYKKIVDEMSKQLRAM